MSWRLVAVSQTSLVVSPRWSHRPSGPVCPVIELRNAVISCRVSFRISWSRSMS